MAQEHLGLEAGATSLAAFHTLFVAVGAALLLPFVNQFVGVIERVLPDRGPKLTRHIDKTLLQDPAVALEATRRALIDTASELFISLHAILRGRPSDANDLRSPQIKRATVDIQQFLAKIPSQIEDEPLSQSRVADQRRKDRSRVLEQTVSGASSPMQRLYMLDAMRWLEVSQLAPLLLPERFTDRRTDE